MHDQSPTCMFGACVFFCMISNRSCLESEWIICQFISAEYGLCLEKYYLDESWNIYPSPVETFCWLMLSYLNSPTLDRGVLCMLFLLPKHFIFLDIRYQVKSQLNSWRDLVILKLQVGSSRSYLPSAGHHIPWCFLCFRLPFNVKESFDSC